MTSNQVPHDKEGKEIILNPDKLRKAVTRWNQCVKMLMEIDQKLLQGPVLDCGCGVGWFVLEGLQREMDVWGVDPSPGKINRYQKLLEYSTSARKWQGRCLVGSGSALPFGEDQFAVVCSWWVLEHVATPEDLVKEVVRVTQPGGVVVLRAQDARSCWEGHCKIPWIPYLSGKMARIWIDEFGVSPSLHHEVYDVTQPQIIEMLQSSGCEIIAKAPTPGENIIGYRDIKSEDELRKKARQVKEMWQKGEWLPRPEGLYLCARKI